MGICARIYVQTQMEADFRPIPCGFVKAWLDFGRFLGSGEVVGDLGELGWTRIYTPTFGQGRAEADFWRISCGFAKAWVDSELFWRFW